MYCKTGKKPENIPSNADKVYRKEWKGWGDWLGTGKPPRNRTYLSFQDARKYVQSLALGSQRHWLQYCKSGEKPIMIPYNPERIYTKEWKGMRDWLGTGTIASQDMEYLSFLEAQKFVQTLFSKCLLIHSKNLIPLNCHVQAVVIALQCTPLLIMNPHHRIM